jgi:hypothetical protein
VSDAFYDTFATGIATDAEHHVSLCGGNTKDGIDHNCYSEDLIRTDIAERKPFIAKLFPNPSDGLALLH